VSGVWDTVGLLFGLSGFLLFAGPAIITRFYVYSLLSLPVSEVKEAIDENLTETWLQYMMLCTIYWLAVIGGSVYLLVSRRDRTVIYNVEPAVFDEVFPQVLNGLGIAGRRVGNRLFLRSAPAPISVPQQVSAQIEGHEASHPEGMGDAVEAKVNPSGPIESCFPAGEEAVLDIDHFEAMHHVTLHWRSNSDLLRQAVDSTLARTLTQVPTYYNPAANWFIGVSACLFCLLFLDLGLIVFAAISGR
jgi:hypothetical protein